MKDSQGIELFEEEIQKLISYRIHLRKIISLMKKKKSFNTEQEIASDMLMQII